MVAWSIQQGSSTDLKIVTIENVIDYTGYYGNIAVLKSVGRTTIVGPVAIAADSADGFTVGLLPAHTQSIPPGNYLVVFEISKGTDPVTYRKEINWTMEVSASLINV